MCTLQFDGESRDWFRKTLEKSPHGFNWNGFVQLRRQMSTNVYAGEYRTPLLSKGRYQKCRDHEEHVFFSESLVSIGPCSIWDQHQQKMVCLSSRLSQAGTKTGGVHPQALRVVGVGRMGNKRENRGGSIENRFLRSFLLATDWSRNTCDMRSSHNLLARDRIPHPPELSCCVLVCWKCETLSISHGTREDQGQFWNDKRRRDPKETWIRLAVCWLRRRPTVRRHEA